MATIKYNPSAWKGVPMWQVEIDALKLDCKHLHEHMNEVETKFAKLNLKKDCDKVLEDYNLALERHVNALYNVTDITFTIKELTDWLYTIALNNSENEQYCKFIEDIVSRLDGFQRYVFETRTQNEHN